MSAPVNTNTVFAFLSALREANGKNEVLKEYRREESWKWWCMPVIPALGRLRQEDLEFLTSLTYTARPCFAM
jgi:hypothetical protein